MYYTYIWRDAEGVPFYVGKGKDRRATRIIGRSRAFKDMYAQGGCSVEIECLFIHETQAHAREIELIERYGRREFGGLLINMTDGGEGVSGATWTLSNETRQKMRRPKSMEARAKMSANNGMRRPEVAIKMARVWVGRQHSIRSRNLMSANNAMRNPDIRAKNAASQVSRPPNGRAFKGISFEKKKNKWAARIRLGGINKRLGLFDSAEEAARAYDMAAFSAWGSHCYLNFGLPEANTA